MYLKFQEDDLLIIILHTTRINSILQNTGIKIFTARQNFGARCYGQLTKITKIFICTCTRPITLMFHAVQFQLVPRIALDLHIDTCLEIIKIMVCLNNCNYHKVVNSNTSCLEAHAGFFKLLMKWIRSFDLLTKS